MAVLCPFSPLELLLKKAKIQSPSQARMLVPQMLL
jgi:hypothetical protein